MPVVRMDLVACMGLGVFGGQGKLARHRDKPDILLLSVEVNMHKYGFSTRRARLRLSFGGETILGFSPS